MMIAYNRKCWNRREAFFALSVLTLAVICARNSCGPYISSSVNALSLLGLGRKSKQCKMEATVRRYFEGVNQKDPDMIRSCFRDVATIRDVCGINDSKKTVPAEVLVERCMEFVTAHPDCLVRFHYGPECGRSSDWVVAHWYEVGTWSGESCGLKPTNAAMAVEGQTRFRVSTNDYKIEEFVVTRTFTAWENAMLADREQQQQQQAS